MIDSVKRKTTFKDRLSDVQMLLINVFVLSFNIIHSNAGDHQLNIVCASFNLNYLESRIQESTVQRC